MAADDRFQNVGHVTIEQNDIDTDPKSRLRLTHQFPPEYEVLLYLSFTCVVDRSGEPLVLNSKEPATLIGSITQYPPRGDQVQLKSPVDLIDPKAPDTVMATIEQLPAEISTL